MRVRSVKRIDRHGGRLNVTHTRHLVARARDHACGARVPPAAHNVLVAVGRTSSSPVAASHTCTACTRATVHHHTHKWHQKISCHMYVCIWHALICTPTPAQHSRVRHPTHILHIHILIYIYIYILMHIHTHIYSAAWACLCSPRRPVSRVWVRDTACRCARIYMYVGVCVYVYG